MMTVPLVSVIIPTYNFAHSVSGAIDSALEQDYGSLQVLVADDGSSDDTLDVLDAYRDRIEVLALPHRGENATRNDALRVARGEYIAFLDHDDLWLPQKISTQVRAMEANPAAGLCHTGYMILEKGRAPLDCTVRGPLAYHGRCFDELFRQNGVGTLTVVVRREVIPDHLFYEDVQITADYAMWLEILFDHEALYIPEALACHRRHPGQVTHLRERRWAIFEGMSRLRLLARLGGRVPEARLEELRSQALEMLAEASMSRYREADYAWARLGFKLLQRHGWRVPWYRRGRTRALDALNALVGRDRAERRLARVPR